MAGIVLTTLLSAGCQREDVSVYRVPKDTNQPAAAVSKQPAPMFPPPPQTRSAIRWAALPPGWKEMPAGGMRAASFMVEEGGQKADVSVIALGGMAGGTAPNVNRWRGQINLQPASEDEITQAMTAVDLAESKAQLVDLRNESAEIEAGNRILAAILPRGEQTWFIKMQGADALVGRQKEAFTGFLKGVSFGDAAPVAAASTPELPPSHPPIAAGAIQAPETPGTPKWEVPANWQPQPPKTMLLAVFAIAGDSGKGEVTVSSFPGDVGGLSANVVRWRRQLGLGAPGGNLTEADLAKLTSATEVNGETATLVDMVNDATNSRLAAVILPHAGATWFFKLTGPNALVAKEKAAFLKFVQSVRFPKNA
jgi:hypothetical protein